MIYNTNAGVTDRPLAAWRNLVLEGTLTASGSAAGAPVSGLLNGFTTDPWRPDAMPATVTLELPASATAGAVCFAAHDMGSQGVTVAVDRWDGAAWIEVIEHEPSDNAPLILSFAPADADEWRVRFTGDNTFRLSVLSIGPLLEFPGVVIPPHVPLHRASEVDLVGDSESGTGEFLQADFQRTGGRANIAFSVQLPEFASGDVFELFRQHFNKGRPFFFASFPTYDPRDVGYLWRGQGAPSILVPFENAVFMNIGMECGLHHGI